ncbi:MAG TPA: DoxX family membrane protein [Acidimicrobiales bacterium]|nr:DoxX family membrane protein [Acidimicrobiales bacterium]
MRTSLLHGAQWAAVLRIGLGLWWLESFRHKNLTAWIKRQAGINWAADIAAKHRFAVVRTGFDKVVRPHPKAMTWVVLMSELALGLGLTVGLLTPVAAFASIALNLLYFTLMIHDWAEQGQNLMMALAAAVVLGLHGWQVWSIDCHIGIH